MPVRQISILSENLPGVIRKITETLARANVNIRAFSVADAEQLSIFRMIVNDTDEALRALEPFGFTVAVHPVAAVVINDDRPGELSRIAGLLSENDLNIEYMYAFTIPSPRRVYVAVRVANVRAAEAALEEGGVSLLDDDALRFL